MGLFDMGEGESSFEGGMSEINGGSLAKQQQELTKLKQQENRRKNASLQEHAREQIQRAASLKKKSEKVKQLKRLRYLRYIGCCFGSLFWWIILIVGGFVAVYELIHHWDAVVDFARENSETYDSAVTGTADIMCDVLGGCDYDPNAK